MKRALSAVLAHNWAITPEYLEIIASVAERENEYAGNIEALQARLGRPLGNTMSATVRDGIAIIPIDGPIFSKANLFTDVSGATSYQTLSSDLNEALDNPMVNAIMLNISSPGGEVEGASELATMISQAKKPVWAYVGGTGASAAYWIASAADKVFAADTAMVGSIGVMVGYSIKDAKPGEKSYKFISTQSPLKNASPDSEAGAMRIQANIDAIAQVFIDSVAKSRNKSAEDALEWTGQGEVFVAAEAVERGLIDGIATFEAAFETLKSEVQNMEFSSITAAGLREHRADLVAEIESAVLVGTEPVDLDAIRAEGAAAERERIAGLEALAMPGTEDLVAKFKADGTHPAQAAIEILKAAKAGGTAQPGAAAHLQSLKKTEDALQPPAAGTGEDAKPNDAEAASAVIALARKAGIDA